MLSVFEREGGSYDIFHLLLFSNHVIYNGKQTIIALSYFILYNE